MMSHSQAQPVSIPRSAQRQPAPAASHADDSSFDQGITTTRFRSKTDEIGVTAYGELQGSFSGTRRL